MSIIPLMEAKARLSEIADEIHRTHERVSVTRNGREYVVIFAGGHHFMETPEGDSLIAYALPS